MTTFDEFSFLPEQATEAGLSTVPRTRRLTHTLADGRTLSAIEYAPADSEFGSPTVTLLHGAGLNAHTWDTTVLYAGIPALAIDLPGHGDSSWRTDADYSPQTLAPDVVAALEAWTTAPQVLVGQSLGGLTAATVAATAPDHVRQVVMVDIAPGIDPTGNASQIRQFFAGPTDWATREELVDRALSFGLGGSREQAARGVLLNSRERTDGRVEWKHHFAHIANALSANPDAAAAIDAEQRSLADIVSSRGWADVTGIRAPLALVYGDEGFLTAADLDAFRSHVPQARLIEVHSGHNVQEADPKRLAEISTATLESTPGRNES